MRDRLNLRVRREPLGELVGVLAVRAAAGQAVLSRLDDCYLVVLYDQQADVTQVDAEAAAAVEQVRLSARIA